MSKVFVICLFVVCAFSCVEKDVPFKTFSGDMIYSYLQKDTAYSEYVKVIDKAGLKGMLSAYGEYTCLAPNNAAFRRYYSQQGQDFNFESLNQGQVDTLARTHIVDIKLLSSDLTEGVVPSVNMNQRFIEVTFTNDPETNAFKIMLNDSSQVILRDKEVYNGVVQGIDKLLQPSTAVLPALIEKNEDISIFSEALNLTRLCDSLLLIKDYNYQPTRVMLNSHEQFEILNPKERKYGFTALIEPDAVFFKNGINNIEDLIAKTKELYPNSKFDDDYTNRENSLNKFIAYHLINKAIYYNKFFYTTDAVQGYVPDEFIETMYPNRIIRASMLNAKITLNPTSDFETRVTPDGSNTTINGLYHLIDNLLIYSPNVEEVLQNTRIRFDIVSLFPEFSNNNIRGSRDVQKTNNSYGDQYGFEIGYIDNIKMSNETRLIYYAGREGQWANFQSDELMGLGSYDITMRLLPVPPGTYELRFAYTATSKRSVTQIYVDNKPVGIPLDLRIWARDPKIGWVTDLETEDNGFENDKMMRNRGYMKGPTTYYYGQTLSRNYNGCLRRIVGTFTSTDYMAHTLRFKSVLDDVSSQCMMDYIELVPKSIFNPPTGEAESRD